MGQMGSSMAKKIFPHRSPKTDSTRKDGSPDGQMPAASPYVLTRSGSMYFDEDGDLAHEFYVEIKTSRGAVMKKQPLDRLKPQGEVDLPHPRFNADFPVILYEVVQR